MGTPRPQPAPSHQPPRRTRRAPRQRAAMALPGGSKSKAGRPRCLGRCRHFFWLGVACDAVGVSVLFVGVFADLFVHDLLLYVGSIVMFLSLLWWVFWFTGNLELDAGDACAKPLLAGAPSQHRSFSLDMASSSSSHVRRGPHRRSLRQSTASLLSRIFRAPGPRPPPPPLEGGQAHGGGTGSGGADGSGGEHPRPEPEAVECPGGAGPRGPEAGRPSAPPVQPEAASSALSQPPPPAAVVSSKSLSVVPSSSASRPPAVCHSRSVPTSLAATTIQPLVPVGSASPPGAPWASSSRLLDSWASETQTAGSAAAQSHLLVPMAAQHHCQGPVDPERDFQNRPLASRAQPPPGAAFQTQASLTQLTPAPFLQTQPVDPRVTLAGQDSQALYTTQQATLSTPLARETELSPPAQAQEPAGGQELSQEDPDPVSPLPEAPARAPEAPQAVAQEREPAPTTQSSRHV